MDQECYLFVNCCNWVFVEEGTNYEETYYEKADEESGDEEIGYKEAGIIETKDEEVGYEEAGYEEAGYEEVGNEAGDEEPRYEEGQVPSCKAGLSIFLSLGFRGLQSLVLIQESVLIAPGFFRLNKNGTEVHLKK